MITELTQAQKDRFPEYVDKWLKIGLSTDRVNRDTAKWISDYYYTDIADKKPVPIVIMSSPLYSWLAVCFWSQVRSQVRSQVESQVGSQVWSQVRSQVRSQVEQVRSQVRSQVESQVGSQVRSQVESQVGSQVGSQVWSQVEQVWSQVGSQVRSQVGSLIYPYIEGQFFSSYFSFYNFITEVLDIKFLNQAKYNWYQRTSEIGWMYPLDNVCIISERPIAIRMRNGRLHSDKLPSIEYSDGFAVYSLNGIKMKPEYVLTPASEITPDIILKEQNVDVRRELIRKVGVQRLKDCGKLIEQIGDYQLLDMSAVFAGIQYAPHLLMKNPSVDDTWHLEGVSPECKTVEQSINWRAGNITKEWKPYELS